MANKRRFESEALVHLDALYRGAVALCHNVSDADDLLQATYLKAFERFESFQEGSNCKAWLFKIMRNHWLDDKRREMRTGTTISIEEQVIEGAVPKEQTAWTDCTDLLENFSDEEVIRALKQLPDDQRLTLFLTDVENLSQIEVAEIIGVAVGTVKSRSSRARNELREKLLAYAKRMRLTGDQ